MSDPDPDDDQPRPLMGRMFWVMLVLGFICVLAGIGVATLIPQFFPAPA